MSEIYDWAIEIHGYANWSRTRLVSPSQGAFEYQVTEIKEESIIFRNQFNLAFEWGLF